jgi:hypothetical protein
LGEEWANALELSYGRYQYDAARLFELTQQIGLRRAEQPAHVSLLTHTTSGQLKRPLIRRLSRTLKPSDMHMPA